MKTKQAISVFLLLVFLLSGCGKDLQSIEATEHPIDTGISHTQEPAHTLYFPDEAPYYFTYEGSLAETVFLDEIILTNTTQITVKNKSDISLTCNLSYPDDPDYPIQTHTVKPGKKASFRNLTAAAVYVLSFQGISDQADGNGTIDVKITG